MVPDSGRYQESEDLFRTLIAMAPVFGRGHLGLAITLDKSGQPKEALVIYEKALGMNPSSRSAEFIQKRIVQLNKDMGRAKTKRQTTLVLVK